MTRAREISIKIAKVLLAAGIVLHTYEIARALFGSDLGWSEVPISLFFWMWLLTPYAAAAYFLWGRQWSFQSVGWLSLVLAFDLVNHYSVFIQPTSSTAGLIMIFGPWWNLILLGPIGALLGWGLQRIAFPNAGAL